MANMVASEITTHIVLDKKGVAWIDDTNVKVVEVVLDHLAYGHSPEEIQLQHPHLSLAQVYAAFAYYYDHQTRLDEELKMRHASVEKLRAANKQSLTRRKLAARNRRT
jgi:uncharacterized protein (DUF433 family)